MDNRVSDERSRALLLFLNKLHMILQPCITIIVFLSFTVSTACHNAILNLGYWFHLHWSCIALRS
jgi:hypothetical protein